MRRIIIIGTAVAVLVGAPAAVAAVLNDYTGTNLTFNGPAGSPAKPAPIGYVQTLKAKAVSNDRAAPLVDIKTTFYGIVNNGGSFPVCTDKMISADHLKWDAKCPPGSRVGSGPVHAILGPSDLKGTGSPCEPWLNIYNGGKGVQWFFFNLAPQKPGHVCANLVTGASAPYKGFIKQVGKNLVIDVPLPPDVSTQAGGLQGAYGSLIGETLTFPKLSKVIKGKRVGYMASIGCKSGKRPWRVDYTATTSTGQRETRTVTGNAKC